MSLTIEQNWKWSNKSFPHTLCVVSTSDETTQCRICLTFLTKKPALGIRGRSLWFLVNLCKLLPQFSLAGKSNTTFSSKMNRFKGIIILKDN